MYIVTESDDSSAAEIRRSFDSYDKADAFMLRKQEVAKELGHIAIAEPDLLYVARKDIYRRSIWTKYELLA